MKNWRLMRRLAACVAAAAVLGLVLLGMGALRGRMLVRRTLDGREARVQENVPLSSFSLLAQMHSEQTDVRVRGWLNTVSSERVSIPSDRGKLAAGLYAPMQGEGHDAPWALVVHGGVGTDHTQVLDVACMLSMQGYRVLAPDLYAHGGRDGEWTSLGICEAEDIAACVNWILAEQMDARIVIFAQEEGAAAALLAASAGLPDAVRAIAADSVCRSVRERAYQLLSERMQSERSIDRKLFDAAYRVVHGVSIGDGEVVECMRNIRIPVLLIHGTGDQDIPAWHSEDAAAAGGENAELLYIEGAPHGMARFLEPEVYEARLLSFFEEAVSGR